MKMSGFAEKEIAMNSEKDALDNDEKIGAREIISGVSCNDSRDRLVVISSVYVKEGCYRTERHGGEIVFQRKMKREGNVV